MDMKDPKHLWKLIARAGDGRAVDQCLGFSLREPNNRVVWELNENQAPIPTRHKIWDHPICNIRVISTIEFTEPSRGIELHLSISQRLAGVSGVYPEDWMIQKVREDFDALDFEKDDHGSKVCHLWLPVERDKRGDCDCHR